MIRRIAVRAALVAAALVPLPAGAQAPAELRVGQTITGALTSADPATRDSGRFQVFAVSVGEGQRLVATLRSGAFDALLTLMRPVGGIMEPIASDDDGGGGTDSRLRFSVPTPGTYLLVAQSLTADGIGGFTLSLEEGPAERAATPQPIRIGESRDGRLAEDAPLRYSGDQDILYHLYTFDARAGQEVVILLDSADFDAYLSFGPLAGADIEATMDDDDGGGGTNARIRTRIPADGRYGVHARGLNAGATGAYTLTVREATDAPPRALTAGADITGTLGPNEADSDNRFHDLWHFEGAAGERATVRMRSDEFDTLLILGRMIDGVFTEIASNDDAEGDGSNSRIEHVLPAGGTYLVRATSFETGVRGAYTLRLDTVR